MTPDQNIPNNDNSAEPSDKVNVPINISDSGAMTNAEPVSPTSSAAAAEGETTTSTASQALPPAAAPQSPFSGSPAMPSAATGSPVIGTEITMGSNTSGPTTTVVGHHGRGIGGKKRLFAAALTLFVLVGLGAGYVFAFYIPNKPENVWKSALTNTGKAYDMLSEYATKNKDAKGVKVEGSYKLSGLFASDGSLSGKSVGQDGQVSGNFSAAGIKIGFDVRTLKSSGDTPDLYFKLNGLQGLGGLLGGGNAEVTSIINGINNQWFVVDHTLFQQFGTSASKTQFTKADADSFLKAFGTPSKQYLFTADPSKAVFVVKDTVGAEKKDGRNTYHYKVTYDSAHLGAYVKALCSSLQKDKIGKLVVDAQGSADCTKLAGEARAASKTNDTADVWVDKRTKLVHVVRFSDPKNASNYAEVGQDYQGGDEFPFSFKINDKESGVTTSVKVTGTLNTKLNTFTVKGDFTYGSGSQAESGTFDLTVSPSNDTTLKVDKPANAKTLIQLLDSLGLGSLLGSSTSATPGSNYAGIQAKARDTERQTDIRTLQSHLEAYYAEKGYYPTLAQLNNSSWVATNLRGIDGGAFKDPQGTTKTLVASPVVHAYAYQGTSCTNTHCKSYTLTAMLEVGGTYAKSSLN